MHWDGPYEKKHDSIPLFENICYATALMRLKEKEAYLEGKELIERLMPFQMDGKFPFALHDYPKCIKTFDFEVKHFDPKPYIPNWIHFKHFLKDGMSAKQEGFEPKKTALDQTLAYLHGLPPTKLSPEYLHLALIEQEELELQEGVPSPTWVKTTHSHTLFWKDQLINSLALFSSGMVSRSDNKFTIELSQAEIQDEKEINLYINRNINPQFFSEGKRVTAFKLEHPLEIKTDSLGLRLSFEHETNEQLYGHLALLNRPGQLLQTGEVFDYCISIRTIRRNSPLKIILKIELIPSQ